MQGNSREIQKTEGSSGARDKSKKEKRKKLKRTGPGGGTRGTFDGEFSKFLSEDVALTRIFVQCVDRMGSACSAALTSG